MKRNRRQAPRRLSQIEQAIDAHWTRETSEDPREWPKENQRAAMWITALVLRELLGGDILIASVSPREARATCVESASLRPRDRPDP